MILFLTIVITFTIIPYVFSTVFKYVFQIFLTPLNLMIINRQMEAANRLDDIREMLNLTESDPIPQVVLGG